MNGRSPTAIGHWSDSAGNWRQVIAVCYKKNAHFLKTKH